jgi:hypothetical protein
MNHLVKSGLILTQYLQLLQAVIITKENGFLEITVTARSDKVKLA